MQCSVFYTSKPWHIAARHSAARRGALSIARTRAIYTDSTVTETANTARLCAAAAAAAVLQLHARLSAYFKLQLSLRSERVYTAGFGRF